MLSQRAASLKIISFDVWLTILDINKDFSQKRKKLFFDILECNKKGIDEQSFYQAFDQMKRETEQQSEIRGIHIGLAERTNYLCKSLGLEIPSLAIVDKLENKQSDIALNNPSPLMHKKTHDLFNDLTKSGIKIAVINNTGMV